MPQVKRKSSYDPSHINWFNLDNRYATRNDLHHLGQDIKQTIQLAQEHNDARFDALQKEIENSNQNLQKEISHSSDNSQNEIKVSNNSLQNNINLELAKMDTKLANMNTKIAKVQLHLVLWIIATGIAVSGIIIAVVK